MKQNLVDFIAKRVRLVTCSASPYIHRCVKALVLAVAVLVATGTANAVEPKTLPPDIRQTLQMAFAYISPEGQTQILIAIRALTPPQAQQAVMTMRLASNYAIQFMVLADRIRAGLAPTDRQRYINGMWGVSRADEAFSGAVNQQVLASLQNQAGGMGTAPPFNQDQLNEIARRPFSMLNDEKTRETWHKMWNALGGAN